MHNRADLTEKVSSERNRDDSSFSQTPLTTQSSQTSPASLQPRVAVILLFVATISFHLAFAAPQLAPLIAIYLGCLVELTRLNRGSVAFGYGMIIGLLVFVPKLSFFFTIFSAGAVVLWMVLALWHGLFLYVGQWARSTFKPSIALLLLPIFWTGLEYFRSELYYLKFSWLAGGYAFASQPNLMLSQLGIYGTGFAIVAVCSLLSLMQSKLRFICSFVLFCLFAYSTTHLPAPPAATAKILNIAGVQLEFPVELEIPGKLDALKRKYPEAEMFVLSEYTFDGPIPLPVRKWCAKNSMYLIAGGKDPLGTTNYYNTAFVIGLDGEVIFKQAKSVPIQFFKDGLPAPDQRVWNSPWGKIGILICYDLSYTRVVDELVRQGAGLLIVPTMDVMDWGEKQHGLHALIAPTRAAEYHIPIFRLASSGISQAVSPQGKVMASAPSPGQDSSLSAKIPITMAQTSQLPLDRTLAPVCSTLAAIALLWSFFPRKKLIRVQQFIPPSST